MKTIPLLTLLLCGTVAFGQPESCLEATPFQYFHCESFNPATTPEATLCYSFHTSGTAVDFSFGYFAYCPDLEVTYTLYNTLCDSITSNTSGYFDIAPEVYYVICGKVSCLDTTGLGVAQICTAEMLALPVELVSMTGYPTDNAVVLEWTTATEHDSWSFAILRSVDLVAWDALTEVPAAGHSLTTKVYRWSDTAPIPGTVYYQLKSTDVDGTQTMLIYLPVTWKGSRAGSSLGPFDTLGRRVK